MVWYLGISMILNLILLHGILDIRQIEFVIIGRKETREVNIATLQNILRDICQCDSSQSGHVQPHFPFIVALILKLVELYPDPINYQILMRYFILIR